MFKDGVNENERLLNCEALHSPVVFAPSEGCEELCHTSYKNRAEGLAILKFVRRLLRSGCNQEDIGVVSW